MAKDTPLKSDKQDKNFFSSAEHERLATDGALWKKWGPYLSERAWGTVREDYSAGGEAWEYFPHDHARSRVYRWNEDGLGGISDDHQFLCFAFAFWNKKDPIIKERIFGLTGNEGNHGEDAKEYWWYLDSTPTHSYMRWRYLYPIDAFPYADLVDTNKAKGKLEPEYELVDTHVLDNGRYFDITATYAKSSPTDYCIELSVTNRSKESADIDVMPTLWFRNTWSYGRDERKPIISRMGNSLKATHVYLGDMYLSGDGSPLILFTENETNYTRLYDMKADGPFKDGFNDYLLHDYDLDLKATEGTKACFLYHLTVPPGETVNVKLRLSDNESSGVADDWTAVCEKAKENADEFYAAVTPSNLSPDEKMVLRRAFSSMLWSKQYYHYDVAEWLDGDPGQPAPPEERKHGRNADWRHLNNKDILAMPDKWEYPWFAAWDLAFHCATLAYIDPEFAKEQLILLCREWYMHPNGQLPAYEWAFSDVNPPVQAWAALQVFKIDGSKDYLFLEKVFTKLLINFTWWVNKKDAAGNNVFEGGFLGLDNIGPIDRSAQLPVKGILEQSDGTSWMAMYCLNMLEIALVLALHDKVYEDLAIKFFEHFAYIGSAMYSQNLWDEKDSFYYDLLCLDSGETIPLRVKSLVGLIPMCATSTLSEIEEIRQSEFDYHMKWFLERKPEFTCHIVHDGLTDGDGSKLFSVVEPEKLKSLLKIMLDESEFLSPYGLRSVSRIHKDDPFVLQIGDLVASVDYEPGESISGLFGGNSNWRGPIWFPINFLLIEALRRFHDYLGDSFTVECPTGSGTSLPLDQVADFISDRLISIFCKDKDGKRPVFGEYELFRDKTMDDVIFFHEYFHGDDGHGLGASHQTGWTGLVANLLMDKGKRKR